MYQNNDKNDRDDDDNDDDDNNNDNKILQDFRQKIALGLYLKITYWIC